MPDPSTAQTQTNPDYYTLKLWILQSGYKQCELARKFGVSNTTISNVLRGWSPNAELRQKIIDLVKPDNQESLPQ